MSSLFDRLGDSRFDPPPPETHIAVGERHRVTSAVDVSVRDYDSLSGRTIVLPAGAIFRVWKPLDHWRGKEVPITLGDAHTEFDWGVTSFEGHFIEWRDFFEKCERVTTGSQRPDVAC